MLRGRQPALEAKQFVFEPQNELLHIVLLLHAGSLHFMFEVLNRCRQIAQLLPDFFNLGFVLLRRFSQGEQMGEIAEQLLPHDQAAFISASMARVCPFSFSISA